MVKFAKAIAANTDLLTAQAFIYQRDGLFLAFIISASGDDVFTRVRMASTSLEDSFFDGADSVPDRLDQSIKYLQETLATLEELQILICSFKSDVSERIKDPEVLRSNLQPEDKSVLYLVGSGNQRAYLLRGDEVIPLVSPDQSGQLISGYLENGDRMVMVNEAFDLILKATEDSSNRKIFSLLNTPLDSLEEEVNSQIMGHQSTDPLSAILIDYNSDLKMAKEIEILEGPEPRIQNVEEDYEREPRRRLNFQNPFKDFQFSAESLKRLIPVTNQGRLIIAGILLLVLGIGIFYSFRHKAQKQVETEFQTFLKSSQDEYKSAQDLKDLDANGAKKALDKSKNDLAQALKIKPGDSQALSLKKDIESHSNEILKIYSITNWPVYLDLGLIKSGFSSQRFSLSLGKVALLDPSLKSLVLMDLKSKNTKIVAGGSDLGKASFSSVNGDFIFTFSEDKGILRTDTKSLKTSLIVKTDSDWGKIIDIKGFGGNVYTLDELKNQIWKFTPAGSGYSDKIPYLKSGINGDFAGAKRMMIDSSVWVLKQGSLVDKFTSGNPDSFNLSGLDKPLKEVTAFFVSNETDNIYLLDSGNSRVVILKKNGQYISQVAGDKFKTTSDLIADETNKKLYMLESNKIYQIDLK